MRDIIEAIIGHMPAGSIFDAHTIILCLYNTDAYLQNLNGRTTLSYHADIGHIIAKIANGGLIQRINGYSWSQNIHNNFSKNSCWRKQ